MNMILYKKFLFINYRSTVMTNVFLRYHICQQYYIHVCLYDYSYYEWIKYCHLCVQTKIRFFFSTGVSARICKCHSHCLIIFTNIAITYLFYNLSYTKQALEQNIIVLNKYNTA